MFKSRGVLPAVFILSLCALPHAHARVDATTVTSVDGGTSSDSGTSSGGSASGSTTTGSAGATGNTATGSVTSIPCLDDKGNSNNASFTSCTQILPRCSDIKSQYEKTVKNFLTWKIWGYYQGKNVDLNASTLTATGTNLVGTDLLYPICSIVGHKMQMTGNNPIKDGAYKKCELPRTTAANKYQSLGIEYVQQTIGKKQSCGLRPDTDDGNTYLTLSFRGNGNLWNSWLVGAYPWLIRRNAYDVLTALKPDLSNLSDVISSDSVKTDLAAINTQMASYYTNLASQSKEACSAKSDLSLIDRCNQGKVALTDPANRLCTLVKAQSTVNSGALPNMIVMEIMARVQKQYDSLFANIMSFQHPPSQGLWEVCKRTGAFLRSNRGKKAHSASCVFDGEMFSTMESMASHEDDCNASGNRSGTFPMFTNIATGQPIGFQDASESMVKSFASTSMATTLGFAGVIEAVIRRDICKQNKITDVSICDSINIPDKPDGVQ